ncbi:hypothetical protein MTX78_11490 [Hymenobacter tibetensis]|uniref:Glycosyltransferase RgtA/B/C/D-like domain-containing protein n=1 Tax=Hymenobacter tibetensis TaxID=497967 RepID=A0ABY4CUR1_9BACT|nr:hypothetical protein [Hymenobacter tibetensis]UOG72749.1 hypothetical protein MTX78_11490 [Hymenobacter tibetensis]
MNLSSAGASVSYRFFVAVGVVLLLLLTLGLGLVFGFSSYADIEHLRHARYHDSTFRYLVIPLEPAGYALAKNLLLALLGGLVGIVAWQLQTKGTLYQELAALRQEWRTGPSVLAPWHALTLAERRTGLLLLAVLFVVRGYYVLRFPLYGDELVTYFSFVREGAVAATSFYPIPNNHILYSAVCWVFSLLSTNFYWVMRGPAFLISMVGTMVVGLLLLRRWPFQVVALSMGLFAFFPYALFQAVVGRGYFLLAVCSQLAFLAGLALVYGSARPRLAWASLVGASVVGFYTIPTFLLVFVGLGVGLAASMWRQPHQLVRLGMAGLLVALATLLLYTPVLLVSGPAALLGNAYVAPGAGHTAELNALPYPALIDGQLTGLGSIGLPVVLAVSLAGYGATRSKYTNHFSLPLIKLLLGLLWLPYVVLAFRGVYPPARVLSFRMFFVFLLGALLLDALLSLPALQRWRQQPALTVVLPVLLWAAVVLVPFQHRATLEAGRNARVTQVYSWLRLQRAHAVLTTHTHYQLYLLFYSQADHWPLAIDAAPQPESYYDFQLLDKEAGEVADSALPVLFENIDVRIHRVPGS